MSNDIKLNSFASELQHYVNEIINSIAQKFEQDKKVSNRILDKNHPEELSQLFTDILMNNENKINIHDLSTLILKYSTNFELPGYIGHQNSPPHPLAIASELISKTFFNANSIFELAPSGIAIEKAIVMWMCNKIGYSKGADGILTSGGSIGNLTSLLAASHIKADWDIWEEGLYSGPPLSILVSDQSHYSITRTAKIMGLGKDGIEYVKTDNDYKITIDALEDAYRKSTAKGRKVFAVVAKSCSTATGSYDPIDKIADYCANNNLWLHIDAAHGASALLSQKYKHHLKGINRADSVVWDAHKMLLCPSLCTGVLFKNGDDSYKSFSLKASYIFGESEERNWYDPIHRTLECTKPGLGIPLFSLLATLGEKKLSGYVESRYDLTRRFAQILKEDGNFEIPVEPQANILCFRFLPPNKSLSNEQLNKIQLEIRKTIVEEGNFYIVQTFLKDTTYLRLTIINPLTDERKLIELMNYIKQIAKEV